MNRILAALILLASVIAPCIAATPSPTPKPAPPDEPMPLWRVGDATRYQIYTASNALWTLYGKAVTRADLDALYSAWGIPPAMAKAMERCVLELKDVVVIDMGNASYLDNFIASTDQERALDEKYK